MLDINTISKRYFDISISVEDDDGRTYSAKLEVEPPKVKALRKIVELSKDKNDENALSEAIRIILSKNKTGYRVPDEIIDNLDIDQYRTILEEYGKWIAETKNSPN